MHAPSGRLDVRRVSGVERTEPRRTATGLGTLCVREQSARRACQRTKPAVAISSMGAERCGRPMQMRPTCASRVGASRGAYRLPGDDQRNVRRAGQRPRPAAATSRMVQDWRTHMRVPRPTGAMRPLWAIRARASQLGRSAPCTRETTASDTRNLSSSKSCGSEAVRARSVRPQSMSTRRSAALSRRTCSPSRALQDCCGDHPQPMQTEAARARARSTTRTHCVVSYQVNYRRRFTRTMQRDRNQRRRWSLAPRKTARSSSSSAGLLP